MNGQPAVAGLPLFEQHVKRPWMPRVSSPPLPPPLARRSDPETSKLAAESVADVAEAQRLMILAFLRARGAQGANASEIDQGLGWPTSTSGRRLHELRTAGFIVKSGERRETASGRLADVYVAVM